MQKEVKIADCVKIKKSIFNNPPIPKGRKKAKKFLGGMLDFKVPKNCDLIILCGNNGDGYIPYRCLLPHQVYLSDIRETFEEEGFEVIYVVPVNSKLPFAIAFNGEYGEQRWKNK